MKSKEKYKIIKPSEQYIDQIYYSKSFFIRYYAYLPYIYSLKNLDFSRENIVLDLGCSDGSFLPTLNKYAKRIIGIDISKKRIKKSKIIIKNKSFELKNVSILCSDGQKLPFRDKQLDIILCFEVLEHVNNPKQVIEEIFRVLRKDGIFICTIPVEIGPSLLIRTVLGKLLKFERPNYSLKELFQNIFLKKINLRTENKSHRNTESMVYGHKNFDWRLIKCKIIKYFKKLTIKYIPINFLREINPIVLIKAIKNV